MKLIFNRVGQFALFSMLQGVSFAYGVSPILAKDAPQPVGVYSQGIRVNQFVFLSGQVPVDPKTDKLISGGFDAQAAQVFDNINRVAKASGASLHDVVKLTVYLRDLKNYAALNRVMQRYFQKPYPARSLVQVSGLVLHAPLEVEAILRTPGEKN